MNMREEFEKLSHAEKVHLFIGSVAVCFFILGAVVGQVFIWALRTVL